MCAPEKKVCSWMLFRLSKCFKRAAGSQYEIQSPGYTGRKTLKSSEFPYIHMPIKAVGKAGRQPDHPWQLIVKTRRGIRRLKTRQFLHQLIGLVDQDRQTLWANIIFLTLKFDGNERPFLFGRTAIKTG